MVVHDIAGMLHEPGGKTGYDTAEEIVTLLLTSASPTTWRATGKAGEIRVVNDTRLEVRAPARQQEEVAQVLAALRQQLDVAVDLRAELHEVDRAYFE